MDISKSRQTRVLWWETEEFCVSYCIIATIFWWIVWHKKTWGAPNLFLGSAGDLSVVRSPTLHVHTVRIFQGGKLPENYIMSHSFVSFVLLLDFSNVLYIVCIGFKEIQVGALMKGLSISTVQWPFETGQNNMLWKQG